MFGSLFMNILVVDDEREVASLLADSLTEKGHHLDVAFDGQTALDLIRLNQYDLAFLDYNMPEITGLEVIKYIKKNKPQVMTVMFTGYEMMEEFLAKSAGADEYLQKPFTSQELEAILTKYDRNKS